MLGGYAGRMLRVDLTDERVSIRDLDEELARKYIGGVGIATSIIWDETTKDTEAFSSENPLIFMAGPLTGTAVPGNCRYIVAGISPLTDIWGQSHSGGTWADELKHAGFDGIIFKGKAKKPVYLWVHDGEAEIRDASHLWGKDTYEVSDLLQKETDEKASVAAIGRAGERLVRVAGIMNDGRDGRTAARCGLGALMGYKNLKAVAVRGTRRPRVNNEEKLKESISKYFPTKAIDDETRVSIGRYRWELIWMRAPIKNFLEGEFEAFHHKFIDRMVAGKPYFCRHCWTSDTESRMEHGRRHAVWEAMAPLGSQCLIDDMEAIAEAYDLCNRYGLDSISTGAAIAFAIEAYEKGLLSKADTDGIDLKWGNHEAMVQMVRKIGERDGFGEVLGEGVKRASERMGGRAAEYAMQVKGLEIPAHDPRYSNALSVEYSTSNRGACHVSAMAMKIGSDYAVPDVGISEIDRFATAGIGTAVAKMQDLVCLVDSLTYCIFPFMGGTNYLSHGLAPSHILEWLNYATGWDMDIEEFLRCGERIFNLQRMINVRRGISRKDDTLPARILTHKRGGEGAWAENLPPLGAMLNEYYSCRGWDEDGIPTREKLMELSL